MPESEKPRPRWTSTWISGVRAAGVDLGYPGERLGLPEEGSGSVAGFGRRLGAIFIDWMLSLMVTALVAAPLGWGANQRSFATLLMFGLQAWLLTSLTGATVGKRLLGLYVARLDGAPIGLAWGFVRSLLLIAAIPPLLWDRDHRGLHDRASNTVVLRA